MLHKKCFRCEETKPLIDFYKHKGMADGHLGKCKTCNKSDSIKTHNGKSEDPKWVEDQRARHRDKYHRLGYKVKQLERNKDKPWTKSAKYKNLNRSLNIEKGLEIHHWSYKDEHIEDVIILNRKSHHNWHRFLTLDMDNLHFTGVNGQVLDTKEKHIKYVISNYPTEFKEHTK